MIRKLLLLLLPVLALVGGIALGDMLRPQAAADVAAAEDGVVDAAVQETGPDPAWFAFPSQFFVPLMRGGDMQGVMILTLSLEVPAGDLAAYEQQEHRLRDALLRQLMAHANSGGFQGNFTAEDNLRRLRENLLRAVQGVTNLPIDGVLIQDIVRQAS